MKFSRRVLSEKIVAWLDQRLYLTSFLNYLRKKSVPNHRHTFWYLFGGLTLFFFIVQVLTGILLLLYYKPTPETAYESVKYIIEEVPFGNVVRAVHVWSAHFMVGAVSIHMFSVFFMKAYRKPREGIWLSGFLLLMLTLGFGFTGYLLPWDTTAFFATQIGTEIPRSIPLLGELVALLLRGGTEVNGETLTRLFALHVAILPLIALLILGGHLLLNQVHGTSRPIGIKELGPPIPFFPTFVRRDWITWLVASVVLIVTAGMVSWGIGPKANPFSSAPVGIRPEWYFWFLYQTLKIVPPQLFSLSGELIVNVVIIVGGLAWWMVPFLDRKASEERSSPLFAGLGLVVLGYLLVMTLWAGISW